MKSVAKTAPIIFSGDNSAWRLWILMQNRMSENVADSNLWTLEQTCSIGELQHLVKSNFREKGYKDNNDWLWWQDAKMKSTFGYELYVWCSPQYLRCKLKMLVCLGGCFFRCGISAKKAKSEMKIHRCFFISPLPIPVYYDPNYRPVFCIFCGPLSVLGISVVPS